MKHKKSHNVYVIGNTNAGKSSFINRMIKNYSDHKVFITTSMLPTTTLDLMEIKLNDKLTIFDTPGLIEEGNVINNFDLMTLKKMIPTKEIKPRTYQLEVGDSLLIENIAQIDYKEGSKNSFTIYVSNDLEIIKSNMNSGIRVFKHKTHEYELDSHQDIVISGLGWIKIVGKAKVDVIVNHEVKVFKRDSII